jgi:hypothetical protein
VPAKRFLLRPKPTRDTAIAVSVFDAWLGPERYSELTCDTAEQRRRNMRHNDLCVALRGRYDVFAIRRRGRYANRRLMFRHFESDGAFQKYVDANDMARTANQFFALAVPALGLIYEQHWDDTNIAWFTHPDGLQSLAQLASEVGLYVLSFDE